MAVNTEWTEQNISPSTTWTEESLQAATTWTEQNIAPTTDWREVLDEYDNWEDAIDYWNLANLSWEDIG